MNTMMKKVVQLVLSLLMLVSLSAGDALAVLKAVGITDPVSTLPSYYLDTNNLALQLCVDQNGFCILPPPFDTGAPITTTGPINDGNFPDESFYYSAEAQMPIDGDTARLTFVMEAAFLAGVSADSGIVFLRTDLVKMRGLTANSTYRVTHPYGTFNFTTDGAGDTTGGGGVAVRLEDIAGVPAQWLPPGMKAGTITGIGPYLTRKTGGLITDIVTGHTYIGDALTPVEVVGSPTGNNFFRIERILTNGVPVTGFSWQTNLFVLMGRVYTGPIPSELTVNATYARDGVSGQIDIFATTQPGAALTLSGTGLSTTAMTPDSPSTGEHFLHIPLATSVLPSNVVMNNSLDLQATPPHPVALADEVKISQAVFNPVSRSLTISAHSRDRQAPLPVLSVPQLSEPNTLDTAGTLVKTIGAATIPPRTVTVISSRGGSDTARVSVVAPVAPPSAADDAASIQNTGGNSVVIDVLANDNAVAPASLNPASVAMVSPAAHGTTAINPLTGVITYTLNPAFLTAGTDSFTYSVADSTGTVSAPATVAITITVPNVPPVASNDTANGLTGAPFTIAVLANDTSATSTINPDSITIVTPPASPAIAVPLNNGSGQISFAASSPGIYSFQYTVKDAYTTPATSNIATVVVTVAAPVVPPAAVNDTATSIAGLAVVINVAANDTPGTNPINAASATVASAPANGTALANAAGVGTVTYTPAPGFTGSDSFTYNIRDNAGTLSNNAVVSVTVAAPTTETITITRAQYTLSSGQWRVDGTTTARVTGQTMKIFNSATVPANATTGLLATVTVAANGTFSWTSANGAPAPNGVRRISILSSLNPNNNKREQVTVTVR